MHPPNLVSVPFHIHEQRSTETASFPTRVRHSARRDFGGSQTSTVTNMQHLSDERRDLRMSPLQPSHLLRLVFYHAQDPQ